MLKFLKRLFGGRAAVAGHGRAEARLRESEEHFGQLVAGVRDYAVFLLDPQGNVLTWNAGAERIKGYRAEEIVGTHFSRFYPNDAVSSGWPGHELSVAAATGRFEDEGWRVRKDGTLFWANVVITALRGEGGGVRGYIKITRDRTDRKQAEEKLRLSEERFRLMVEGVRDYAIFMLDPEGHVATWNAGAEALKGYKASEIVGQHFSKFYPQEAIERGWPGEELRRAAAEGRFEDEGWRVRKDGSLFWANVVITALRDDQGQLRGFSKITRDLTGRKQAEESLRLSEERFRLLVERVGDYAIFMLDPEGHVASWNAGAERIKCYKAEEIVGQHFSKFYPQEALDRGWPAHELKVAAAEGRFEDEGWRVRKDGSLFWANVVITALRDESGTLRGFAKVTRDLTERRQAEEQARRLLQEEAARRVAEEASREIEEQRERLRTTLASIGDAVIATDAEGRITTLNAVAEALTGWASGEAAGQPLDAVFRIVNERTRQPVESPVTRAMREGRIVGLANHTVLIAKDGTERPIDDSAAPIRCKVGEVVGCVLVFRDVTERREAERRLHRSEERYRALVTATSLMVWTTDPDGLVVEDSPTWRAFTGQSFGQWRGRGWLDALHPDDRERAAAAWGRAVGGRTAYAVEYRVRRHDGEYRWTAVRGVPVLNDDGGVREWVGTNTDITDLKRAEEAAAERSRITALRADVSNALAAAQPMREALQGCCEALVAHLGVAFARIWTHDEADGVLILQASAGQYTHLDGPHSRVKVGEFKIGRIAASRQPHLTNDVPHDPEVGDRAWAGREGMVAFAGYPLLVEDRVVGVVAMFARRPLTDAILSDLAPLTDQIAQHVHRKRAEAALRESELRYRLVGQAANDAIWDWDLVTNRVSWNDGLRARFGYTPEQVGPDATWWYEAIHPDERERVVHEIHAAIDGGEELWQDEYRFRRADGSYAEVFDRGRVVREAGRPVRMVGSMLDLTARKRAERTARFLAEASAALADLTDYESTLQKVASLAVPTFADWCAVDMLDEAGERRRVAVTHADPSKVRLAKEVEERYPSRPDAPHGIDRVLRTGEPELAEDIPDSLLAAVAHDEEHLRTLRELGLRSYVCVPIKSLGRTLGGITFASDQPGRRYDASDLRVAQDLASRAAVAIQNASLYRALKEADRRKDEFLATLAHELRNPLAPIRNALQIMKLSGEREAGEQARSLMERQLGQLVRLVDDLMDVSRISRNKLELRRERVELARVVESAVETSRPLVDQQGHRLTVTLPPEPVYLDADLTRLAQVFMNLLNNSAKYTEPGGRIWLTAERQGSDVVVSVRDTGMGIPKDKLPGVFELFSQVEGTMFRSQGGLGIGLSLVKRLVEMHGGSITAHSEGPGRGSTFTVRLPVLSEALRPHQEGERREEAAPTTALRILIVDDNRDSADSLGMMLRLLGNDIQTAYDGVEAVAVAEASRPHVVLLDIGLPRQNGYEACRRIREHPWGRGMVLIALTGWGQESDVRRSHEAGFDHHMVKPVDPNALMKLLASLKAATA